MTVPKVILHNKTTVIYIQNFNSFQHIIKETASEVYIIHFMNVKCRILNCPKRTILMSRMLTFVCLTSS